LQLTPQPLAPTIALVPVASSHLGLNDRRAAPGARRFIYLRFSSVIDPKGLNYQVLPVAIRSQPKLPKVRNPFSSASKAHAGVGAYVDYELFGELACKSPQDLLPLARVKEFRRAIANEGI
jgi:hypothetical protein